MVRGGDCMPAQSYPQRWRLSAADSSPSRSIACRCEPAFEPAPGNVLVIEKVSDILGSTCSISRDHARRCRGIRLEAVRAVVISGSMSFMRVPFASMLFPLLALSGGFG